MSDIERSLGRAGVMLSGLSRDGRRIGGKQGSPAACRVDLGLRSWVPAAPTLLCGGDGDPTVSWLNTELRVAYWGLHPLAANIVTMLDVDAGGGAGDPYARQRSAFEVAKCVVTVTAAVGGATDGGAAAVASAYPVELVPPACLSAVADFFGRQ